MLQTSIANRSDLTLPPMRSRMARLDGVRQLAVPAVFQVVTGRAVSCAALAGRRP